MSRERRPVMRLIKGLSALAALVAVLIGVPMFLVILIGDPLPADFSWDGVVTALTQPDDGSILVGLVTFAAWAAWAVFTASVVVEVVAAGSRQRVRIRLPGLGVPQRMASGLVFAVIALTMASPAPGQAEAAGPSRQVVPQVSPSAPVGEPAEDRGSDSPAPTTSAAVPSPPGGRSYTVEQGDDLWTLAERFYGEGRAWRTIAAANPDRLTGGPDRLEPGWRLLIPGVERPGQDTVEVERGETLSSVAERVCGDGTRWPELYDANRFQLDDPDVVPAGARLVLPARMMAESAPVDRPAAKSQSEKSEHGTSQREAPESENSQPENSQPENSRAEQPDADERAQRGPNAPGADTTGINEEPDAVPGTPAGAETRDRRSTDQPEADRPATVAPPAAPIPQRPAIPAETSPPDSRSGVDPVVAGVAAVGGLLAAAVVSAVRLRRQAQLQARPIGRRIAIPPPAARLAEEHLGRRQRSLGLRTLDLATRAIAAHCRWTGTPLPQLASAQVYEDRLVLQLAEAVTEAPVGFRVDGSTWRLAAEDVDRLRSVPGLSDALRPYPALATIGTTADDAVVVADLERLRLTSIEATDELAEAALAAIAVELSCSPWADDLEVVLVGTCERLPDALGRHTVTRADDLGPVLDRLTRRAAAQREQLTSASVAEHRLDPDRAEPWTPTILIVNRSLSTADQRRLRDLVLTEPPVSVAAVGRDLDDALHRVVVTSRPEGPVASVGPRRELGPTRELGPQLLSPSAVEAVIDLVEATGRTDTTPAPWWFEKAPEAEPDPPDNVTYLGKRFGGWSPTQPESNAHNEQEGAAMDRPAHISATSSARHPVLRLLGPIELVGAAGQLPPRAARQCLEYCAWLLEHPGTTARAMTSALAVAEGTRRSNMSRLRAWLGSDDLAQPYLPDAYSGRIMLHAAVSSDWQRLQILTGRGVNRTSNSGLEAALELVRGAPLADAAPGQWHWAEGLRTDMVSVVRDIGVELADRALTDSDLELARWAAGRALAAAPGDELLIVARIKTEHRAGNEREVERLTLQLAAQARALEVDLRPETVDVLQEMMEGRVRARLA